MILSYLRFRGEIPVRIITDAHKSSTTQAVTTLLNEHKAKMQFVLSGATQFTQFMDIRGGAAQALKNGGEDSVTDILNKYYDPTQKTKYKRRFNTNGIILPMPIADCIDMVERALKEK